MSESNYRSLSNIVDNEYYLEKDPEEAFTLEEIATLKSITTPDDITSITCGDDWKDDHEICIEVEVNGVKFAALHIIPEFYADIVYACKGVDSAKENVIEYIASLTTELD